MHTHPDTPQQPPPEAIYLDRVSPAKARFHVGRYERALALAATKGGRWLDAGCGSGYGAALLLEYADSVVAVDKNPEVLAYAREHYPGPEYVEADLTDPTWFDDYGPFDVIFCVEVLEHLTQAQQIVWLELAWRNLTPTGVLVVTCPLSLTGGGPSRWNPYHLYEPTLDELGALLGDRFADVRGEFNDVMAPTTCKAQSVCIMQRQTYAVARNPLPQAVE